MIQTDAITGTGKFQVAVIKRGEPVMMLEPEEVKEFISEVEREKAEAEKRN